MLKWTMFVEAKALYNFGNPVIYNGDSQLECLYHKFVNDCTKNFRQKGPTVDEMLLQGQWKARQGVAMVHSVSTDRVSHISNLSAD